MQTAQLSQSQFESIDLPKLTDFAEVEAFLLDLVGETTFRIQDIEQRIALAWEGSIACFIEKHERFSPTELYIHGNEFGTCSETAVEIIEVDDRLFRGFALLKGEWFPHTWLVDENGLIGEPCDQGCEEYVGVELTGSERQDFISEFATH